MMDEGFLWVCAATGRVGIVMDLSLVADTVDVVPGITMAIAAPWTVLLLRESARPDGAQESAASEGCLWKLCRCSR